MIHLLETEAGPMVTCVNKSTHEYTPPLHDRDLGSPYTPNIPYSPHLVVEFLDGVDFHVLGPRHQPVFLPGVPHPDVALINDRYAGAEVRGALFEEPAVLLAGLEEDHSDRYCGQPHGEDVALDRAEAAQLHRKMTDVDKGNQALRERVRG